MAGKHSRRCPLRSRRRRARYKQAPLFNSQATMQYVLLEEAMKLTLVVGRGQIWWELHNVEIFFHFWAKTDCENNLLNFSKIY